MVILKCHNCGSEKEVKSPPKEFVCKVCGGVNVVPATDGTSSEACGCIAPTGFEWTLPAGKIKSPAGIIYVTSQGSHMTKKEYIDAFGLDPDIALEYMRSHKGVKRV
jgi:hypothetical protein